MSRGLITAVLGGNEYTVNVEGYGNFTARCVTTDVLSANTEVELADVDNLSPDKVVQIDGKLRVLPNTGNYTYPPNGTWHRHEKLWNVGLKGSVAKALIFNNSWKKGKPLYRRGLITQILDSTHALVNIWSYPIADGVSDVSLRCRVDYMLTDASEFEVGTEVIVKFEHSCVEKPIVVGYWGVLGSNWQYLGRPGPGAPPDTQTVGGWMVNKGGVLFLSFYEPYPVHSKVVIYNSPESFTEVGGIESGDFIKILQAFGQNNACIHLGDLYCIDYSSMLYRYNSPNNWSNLGHPQVDCLGLYSFNSQLYLFCRYGYLYRYDGPSNFLEVARTAYYVDLRCASDNGSNLFIGGRKRTGEYASIWRYNDYLDITNFGELPKSPTEYAYAKCMAYFDGELYVGTSQGHGGKIFRVDGIDSYTDMNFPNPDNELHIYCLYNDGTYLYAAHGNGLYRSSDPASGWENLNHPVCDYSVLIEPEVTHIGSDIYVYDWYSGLYKYRG